MSEKEGFFRSWLKPREPSLPSIDTHRAKGLAGAIESYSNRRSAERIEKELSAVQRAYEAATELHLAREEFRRVASRITPENFELIAIQEEMRVKEEFLLQELRLAEAEKKKQQFQLRADAEEALLQAELAQAKLAKKRAEHELYGIEEDEKVDGEEAEEAKRARLLSKVAEIDIQIEDLELEWSKHVAEDTLDEASEQRINKNINRLRDERERLETELDAI